MSIISVFQKIAGAIGGFFTKEMPAVENAFTQAEKIVNIIKTFDQSPTGKTVESIIEALIPGAGPAVILGLHTFLNDFGLVTNALTGTPADIVAQGLGVVGKLTGNSKIVALSNIASIIGHEASVATGGTSTLQQAIVALPLVHNPDLLSVNPTLPASAQVSQAQLDLENQQLANG